MISRRNDVFVVITCPERNGSKGAACNSFRTRGITREISVVRPCDQLWHSNAIVVLADTVCSDLVTAHGFVLVFLYRVARPVQIPFDRGLRPVRVFFERRLPADGDQSPNN